MLKQFKGVKQYADPIGGLNFNSLAKGLNASPTFTLTYTTEIENTIFAI